jgi:DNA-binding beta-propeller fold protein YncE
VDDLPNMWSSFRSPIAQVVRRALVAPGPLFVGLGLALAGCSAEPVTAQVSHAAEGIDVPSLPACWAAPSRLRPVSSAGSSAPVALARFGEQTLAFVADGDDEAVIAVDVDGQREVARLELGSHPEHVLVAPDGRIVVSLSDRDRVALLDYDGDGLHAICSKPVAGEPTGMAIGEGRLLVAARWRGALAVMDAESLDLRSVVDLPRDPYAVALLPDGRAVVSHVVGGAISIVDPQTGQAQRLDATRKDHKSGGSSKFPPRPFRKQRKGIMRSRLRMPIGPTVLAHRRATQAYAVTVGSDGRAYLPASLADGSSAAKSGGYGGGSHKMRTHSGVTLAVAPDATSVDVPFGSARTLGSDCQLPRGTAFDDEQGWLLVTCLGTNSLNLYEQTGEFAGLLKSRLHLAAGPLGVALDAEGGRAVVWSQFDATLTITSLPRRDDVHLRKLASVALERSHAMNPTVALGRKIFHESGEKRRVSSDGRACASCHPDGRDDGMTWVTPEGPRQTPILMARIDGTAPFGWNGRKKDARGHLARTLSRLRGTGLDEQERDALLAYVGAMTPPKPLVRQAELVARGRELYADDAVGCASCHPGATSTDGLQHELAVHNPSDRVRTFDTPSLRFVAQSGPYFHDGRYATLGDLLMDPDSGMGDSASLPRADRHALEAFLHTL